MSLTDFEEIEYLDNPILDKFINEHLILGIPALLKLDDVLNWKCYQLWCTNKKVENKSFTCKQCSSSDNIKYNGCKPSCINRINQQVINGEIRLPNADYLKKFNDADVMVADCKEKEFNFNPKKEIKFKKFLEIWNNDDNQGDTQLYVKDWHFWLDYPDYKPYRVPELFEEDWMEDLWFYKKERDDHRFIYMGSNNTWTPFHTDVFNSNSWSTNLSGIKKWILYPPEAKEYWTKNLGTIYDVNDIEDIKMNYPKLDNIKPLIVYQLPGETIFVPGGWGHQVHNIGNVISVNQNWINGYQIHNLINYLFYQLEQVEYTINDSKYTMLDEFEFEEHCQLILKIHANIDIYMAHDWLYWLLINEINRLLSLLQNPLILNNIKLIISKLSSLKTNLLTQNGNIKLLDQPLALIRYYDNKDKQLQLIHCKKNLNNLDKALTMFWNQLNENYLVLLQSKYNINKHYLTGLNELIIELNKINDL